MILRDVQHVSIAETARILGITDASVKTCLLRARVQMRDALSPGIDGSGDHGKERVQESSPLVLSGV